MDPTQQQTAPETPKEPADPQANDPGEQEAQDAGAVEEAPKKRLHRATFATDKRKPGSYLIRVQGPTAQAFAGRSVPVTRKNNSESTEKLVRCVWAGVDEESREPVALYTFEQKPKEEAIDDLPF